MKIAADLKLGNAVSAVEKNSRVSTYLLFAGTMVNGKYWEVQTNFPCANESKTKSTLLRWYLNDDDKLYDSMLGKSA